MILLLGLPKSGTSSFDKLFEILGYNSYHWEIKKKYIGNIIQNNKKNNLPLLNGFSSTDCITQMDVCVSSEFCYWPQIVDYEQLYFENKDAIFILNTRDPVKILQSFKKWHGLYNRIRVYNPELIEKDTDEDFIMFVNSHYNRIRQFFLSKPDAKFIEYHIENDKLDKLAQFIDLKGIQTLPYLNKSRQ
jgi:hypothetical protein